MPYKNYKKLTHQKLTAAAEYQELYTLVNVSSRLPLLPWRLQIKSKNQEPRRPCKMDTCSKKRGGCDNCPDVVRCIELYDWLCDYVP